jgi:hypothetical protein
MLATTWYTQVLPTATGNGIDPGATTEPVLTVGVAAGLVVPAGLETAPAGLFDDAADDVLVAEPHPASATTAAPARTARADLYLLMVMPSFCEGGVSLIPPCREHGAASTAKGRGRVARGVPN